MNLFLNKAALIALFAACFPVLAQQSLIATDSIVVSKVWSGQPVDFCITDNATDSVYAAYYDSSEAMTVALKPPGSSVLKYKRFTESVAKLGWDSHNYVTMALDAQNLLHVSGNMHDVPLVYYRSNIPGNIDSLRRYTSMVGSHEDSVTYPVFVKGTQGELLYMYRGGSSGNGNEYINKWNPATKTWSRLLGTALFSGQSSIGTLSAYLGSPNAGPVTGPDGYYHLFWFWRATPDAGTNFDVSYMRSLDLVNWQTWTGTAITLPVTLATPGVIIDTIPQNAGLINRGQIGFDAQGRPIITYHKFDATTNQYTQIYNTRLENGKWVIHQTSNWTYKWVISGQGTLILQVQFGPVVLNRNGTLTQWFYHYLSASGPVVSGYWVLDPNTLQPTQTLPDNYWPAGLVTPRVAGMQVNWEQVNSSVDSTRVYALRWETMPNNQDQPRSPIPAPTPLILYTLTNPNVTAISPVQRLADPGLSFHRYSISGMIAIGLPTTGSEAGNARLRIQDIRGKTVADFTLSPSMVAARQILWDASRLSGGLYMVQFKAGNRQFQGRLALP